MIEKTFDEERHNRANSELSKPWESKSTTKEQLVEWFDCKSDWFCINPFLHGGDSVSDAIIDLVHFWKDRYTKGVGSNVFFKLVVVCMTLDDLRKKNEAGVVDFKSSTKRSNDEWRVENSHYIEAANKLKEAAILLDLPDEHYLSITQPIWIAHMEETSQLIESCEKPGQYAIREQLAAMYHVDQMKKVDEALMPREKFEPYAVRKLWERLDESIDDFKASNVIENHWDLLMQLLSLAKVYPEKSSVVQQAVESWENRKPTITS